MIAAHGAHFGLPGFRLRLRLRSDCTFSSRLPRLIGCSVYVCYITFTFVRFTFTLRFAFAFAYPRLPFVVYAYTRYLRLILPVRVDFSSDLRVVTRFFVPFQLRLCVLPRSLRLVTFSDYVRTLEVNSYALIFTG